METNREELVSGNKTNTGPNVNANQNRDQLTNSELNKEDNLDYGEFQSENSGRDPGQWNSSDGSMDELEGSESNKSGTNIESPEAESGNGSSVGNP